WGCENILNEWAKLENINDTNIILEKINCLENQNLVKKLNITSFPTIYYKEKNDNYIKYKNEMISESFLKFLQDHDIKLESKYKPIFDKIKKLNDVLPISEIKNDYIK